MVCRYSRDDSDRWFLICSHKWPQGGTWRGGSNGEVFEDKGVCRGMHSNSITVLHWCHHYWGIDVEGMIVG
jgi:hypothetical protein